MPSLDNLINFWKNNVRKNLSKFLTFRKIIEIVNELNKKIDILETIINNNKNSLKEDSFKTAKSKQIKNELNENAKKLDKKLFFNRNGSAGVIHELKINKLKVKLFNYQEEKLNNNYITKTENSKISIVYIDIDLFLQSIAKGKSIYEDPNDAKLFIEGFCLQYQLFMNQDVLIKKIMSCFNYFYSKYANKNPNITTIPFGLIDLLIIFVQIHIKYNHIILDNDVIKKIKEFFKQILDIYEIKNNYSKKINNTLKQLRIFNLANKIINNNSQKKLENLDSTEEDEKTLNNYSTVELVQYDIKKTNEEIKNNFCFNLMKYDSQDIANEITRVSYIYFNKINANEFFNAKFSRIDKEKNCPNICKTFDRFNNLSIWVIEEILSYDKKRIRAKIIEKFIDIALKLKILNNYNDCMSIISGLNNFTITRLKKTWKYIQTKNNVIFQKLKKFLNFGDNYKNIRIAVGKCQKNKIPYIPFLGAYTKRICFCEEIGPYIKKDTSWMNCDKILEVYKVINSLFNLKNVKYKIRLENYDVLKDLFILQCLDPYTERELEIRSNFLEPKFIINDKKQTKKRRTKTDISFYENIGKYELV